MANCSKLEELQCKNAVSQSVQYSYCMTNNVEIIWLITETETQSLKLHCRQKDALTHVIVIGKKRRKA